MNHCILMLIHDNVELINQLIPLYPREVDIFIHIDNSCNIQITDIKHPVKQIIKVISCEWGKFSIVEATLELLKITQNNYDYYHLVSGACLPLCTINDLNKLEYPKCYIKCFKVYDDLYFGSQWWSITKPVVKSLLNQELKSRDIYLVPDEYIFQTYIHENFPELIVDDNKRFIIMEGIHPRFITKDDDLNGYLFARKVNLDYFKNN